MKKRWIYILCLSALLLMGIFVYYEQNTMKAPENPKVSSEPEEEPIEVSLSQEQIEKNELQLQTATSGNLNLSLSTRGTISLDPNRQAHIMPKVSGVAKEVKKTIGEYAKEGEVLAILESQEMAELKAAYLAAIAKEKLASTLFEREERLFKRKISSGQDYLNARHLLEETQINLQLALQKLQAFGLNNGDIFQLIEQRHPDLSLYEIKAPLSGTIIERHITKGEFVSQNFTIYEIADLSTVWVETSIYPKDLSHVREGQSLEVVNPENQHTAHAQLFYVSPLLSHETIAAKAIALLHNPLGEWRPGAYVNINLSTDKIAAPLLICKEAIQKIEGSECAFVKTEKGFEKRVLQLGQSDAKNVEVVSGLLAGEIYVSNPFLLKAELKKDEAKDED